MTEVIDAAGHWDAVKHMPKKAVIVQYLLGCVFCENTMGSFLWLQDHPNEDTFKATGIQAFTLPWDTEGPTGFQCSRSPSCAAQAKALGLGSPTSFPTLSYYDEAGKNHGDVSDTGCAIHLRALASDTCNTTDWEACALPAQHAAAEFICRLADGTSLPAGHAGDTCDHAGGGAYCMKNEAESLIV